MQLSTKKPRTKVLSPDEVRDLRGYWQRPRGHVAMTLRALGYQCAPHHREMSLFLEDNELGPYTAIAIGERDEEEEEEDIKACLTLMPRGHGKSTVGCVAYPIDKLIREPEERILICSKTYDEAVVHMREIKGHLESNNLITRMYPHLRAKRTTRIRKPWQRSDQIWRENAIITRGKGLITKEPSLMAVGVGGPITGLHFTTIILDDPQDFETTRTKKRRDKFYDWYRYTLLNCLEPGGVLVIIGTRYHRNDIYGILLGDDNNPGELSNRLFHRRALFKNESGELESLWPSHRGVKATLKLRERLGPAAFNAQQQNDVRMMQGHTFKPSWFQWAPIQGRIIGIWFGVDIAAGLAEHNDLFAVTGVALTNAGRWHVVYHYADRLTFNEKIAAVFRAEAFCKEVYGVGATAIGIEAQGTQKDLANAFREAGGANAVDIHHTHDKVFRVLTTLQGPVQSGMLGFVPGAPGVDDLREEMLLFPEGETDDRTDSLQMAFALGQEYQELPVYAQGAGY